MLYAHKYIIFMWPCLFSNLLYSIKLWILWLFCELLAADTLLHLVNNSYYFSRFSLYGHLCSLQFFFHIQSCNEHFLPSFVHICMGLSFFISYSVYQHITSLRAWSLSLILHNTEPGAFYIVGMYWYVNVWWTSRFSNKYLEAVFQFSLLCASRSFKIFVNMRLLLEIKNINLGLEMS